MLWAYIIVSFLVTGYILSYKCIDAHCIVLMFCTDIRHMYTQRLRRQHQLRMLRAKLYNMLRAFNTNSKIAGYRLGRFHTANVDLVDGFCRELEREETGVLPLPYVSRSTSPQVWRHAHHLMHKWTLLLLLLLSFLNFNYCRPYCVMVISIIF